MNNVNRTYVKHHSNKETGETEEGEMITHFRSNKNEALPIESVGISV